MRDCLFRKGLVLTIIIFFIGMSVYPSSGKIYVAASRTTIYDGSLSGYVNDTSMNAIEGALVRVYFHETYEEDYSNSSGYYHVTNIPICYCLKNATCSKEGYKTEWVLLGIVEDTTHDFILSCTSMQVDAGGPYLGYVYENIQFHGYATCESLPYSWKWNFGDGNTSDEQNPIHIYTSPDNYNVSLTVTDNEENVASDTTWALIWKPTPPPPPEITGPTWGTVGIAYEYKLFAVDPDGDNVYYEILWGDGTFDDIGPYESGQIVRLKHVWYEEGTYTIRARVKYTYGVESDWGTFTVTMPRAKLLSSSLFLRFLERHEGLLDHPYLFPILRHLLRL